MRAGDVFEIAYCHCVARHTRRRRRRIVLYLNSRNGYRGGHHVSDTTTSPESVRRENPSRDYLRRQSFGFIPGAKRQEIRVRRRRRNPESKYRETPTAKSKLENIVKTIKTKIAKSWLKVKGFVGKKNNDTIVSYMR